jgi:tetratricopeptide (TPR) repeat protein
MVVAASLLRAGESELRGERFEDARKLFAQAVTEAAEAPDLLLQSRNRLGFALASLGQLEEAKHEFDACVRLAGDDKAQRSAALVNLASLEVQLGAPDRAVSLLREAVTAREAASGENAPETVDALMDLARALMVHGRLEEANAQTASALERLEACVEAPADLRQHLRRAGLVLQVELATRLQRPAPEEVLTELLDTHASDENVLRLVATHYASRKMDRETATVLKRLPETDETLEQLGMLHIAGGRFSEAEEVLTRALERAEAAHGKSSEKLAKPLWLLSQSLSGNKPHDAQRILMRLLVLLKARPDQTDFQARVARQLAAVSVRQGLPNQALYFLRSAVNLAETSGDTALHKAMQSDLDEYTLKRKV